MLPATKAHIAGMLNIVRQCCLSIESAMASDIVQERRTVNSGPNTANDLPLDEDRYCTEAEEDMLAKVLGLEETPPPKTAPKVKMNGN
jgi:hypothetical protein